MIGENETRTQLTRALTRQVSLVEQELFIIPWQLRSPPFLLLWGTCCSILRLILVLINYVIWEVLITNNNIVNIVSQFNICLLIKIRRNVQDLLPCMRKT